MSLLNINFLNENVVERKIKMPHEILEMQRKEIIKALNPKGDEDSKDGMDCVLCAFDLENMKLYFAAANNPLCIVRNGELIEYKAQKMPIGRSLREHEPFELQSFELQAGDLIYTWSDGYPDQFGHNDKKFMSKNLKNLLLEIAHLPMHEQKKRLDQKIGDHMGETEQTDDVLVIGVRV
jgi:serine phosphatase RsbU (regulator of sigma subunit)